MAAAGRGDGRVCEPWITHRSYMRRRALASIPEDDLTFGLTRAMRDYMEKVVSERPDPWFHRKSDRIVLAVLRIDVDGEAHYVQGMNAEVSLPAGGSYCAERTAIVAARSRFPFVLRKNFSGIAILEVPLDFDTPLDAMENPLESCGACMEWFAKLQDGNPAFRIVTFTSHDLDEVVERLPSGEKWETKPFTPKARVSTSTPSSASSPGSPEKEDGRLLFPESLGHGTSTPLLRSTSELSVAFRKSVERPVRRLYEMWRPPQTFSYNEVKKRISWFPTWWLDDLVREGVVNQHADKRYSLNPAFFTTRQGSPKNSPHLAPAPAPPIVDELSRVLEGSEDFDLAAPGTDVPGYRPP
jgi:cytidine deaminase